MMTCPSCSTSIPLGENFCPRCGMRVRARDEAPHKTDTLNIKILYLMVGILILAVLFPPWESSPDAPPEFLGFHFILSPPAPGAVVSRVLQTIQLVTIAIAGLYLSWVFRSKLN